MKDTENLSAIICFYVMRPIKYEIKLNLKDFTFKRIFTFYILNVTFTCKRILKGKM